MTHPEAAREAAEDGQDGGETEETATVAVGNTSSASDNYMVETKGWSGQGNSGESVGVNVNGVIADDVERPGEVRPLENGCRNGDIAHESHEVGVPADWAHLDLDKGGLADVEDVSRDVNIGSGVTLEDEQEVAAVIDEEEEEAEDGLGDREEDEEEKEEEEEDEDDDEDAEEADDVVSETLFRHPSVRGRHDVIGGEKLNSSLGIPGEEREERENTATFGEDREPTPSFIEEQGGDHFDMDSSVVSTLYSAGTRGSATIPGARTPRRNLSGGLLGTKARRSYSRQSSGNLKSLNTRDGSKADKAAWGSVLGTPSRRKTNVVTSPGRFSPSPARERKRREKPETKAAPVADAGSTSGSASAPDVDVRGGPQEKEKPGRGSGFFKRTDSQVSGSSEIDGGTIVARPVHTPTRPWIIRSGSIASAERAVAAAQKGELRIMETFLAGGGDVETRDSKLGMTLLGWAAREGQEEMARLLLIKGANMKAGDASMSTPLHRACSGSSSEVVKLLLDYGADPEAKDQSRRTPLHRAARWGSPECVLLLLDAGADIEARDKELARTPLHYATRSEKLDATLMLLQNGARIEAKTIIGNTPLHLSCDRGFVGNVKLLLEWGANPLVVNEAGKLPVDVPAPWVADSVKATLRELLSKPQVIGGDGFYDDEHPRPTTFRPRPYGAAEADAELMATLRAERAAQKEDPNEIEMSTRSTPDGERSSSLAKPGPLKTSKEPTQGPSVLSNSSVRTLRRLASGSSAHRSRSKPGEGGLPGANRVSTTSSDISFKVDAPSIGGMGKLRKMQSANLEKSRNRGSCCVVQ